MSICIAGYGVHKGYIPDRYGIYSEQAPYQLHKHILESHRHKWRGFASGHVFTPTPVTQVVVTPPFTQVTQVITPSQKMRGSIVSSFAGIVIQKIVIEKIAPPVVGKFFPSIVTPPPLPPNKNKSSLDFCAVCGLK